MCRVTIAPGLRVGLATVLHSTAMLALGLPAGAQAQSVNYEALQDLFREPVTTSVTGKPQRVSDAPAALVIITRADIRRSPAHDIPGLIQAYAGIDVVRWTGGQADISVRGGVQAYDPRLLVLVNGRQVYLDHYGMTNWAGLGVQLEEIQQIEIVRGPNSALFGFNAVSGVVNIITVNPLHTQQRVTTIEAGDRGYLRLSQSAAIKLREGLGLRVSGGLERSDELAGLKASPVGPVFSPGSLAPRHGEGAAEVYASIDERTDGSVSANYSESRQHEFLSTLFTEPAHYRFGALGGRFSHDTGWGVVSGHVLRNWSAVDFLSLTGSNALFPSGSYVRFRNKVFIAAGDAVVRAGLSDIVRIGVEYRLNELTTAPGYRGATHYDVFAGSAMWEHRLNAAITLTAAARIDHLALGLDGDVSQPTIFTKADFRRSFTVPSFNGALLFKPNAQTTVRLAASRGVQAPSLFSLGARIDTTIPSFPVPIVISGNPAIAPARISSAEIEVIRAFEPMSAQLEVTAFYNRTTDVNALSSPATPPRAAPPYYPFWLSTADNVGRFTAYGIEASLSGRFTPGWRWMLNYSWTEAHQNIVGNVADHFERPLSLDTATPRHKIRGQISYENGPVLATVAARYTTSIRQLAMVDPTRFSRLVLFDVPASLALDAKLALKLNDTATITLAGENLTNAAPVGLSPAPAERRLRAGVRISF